MYFAARSTAGPKGVKVQPFPPTLSAFPLPPEPNMVSKVGSMRAMKEAGNRQRAPRARLAVAAAAHCSVAREGRRNFSRRTVLDERTDGQRNGRSGGDDDKTNKELWAVTQFAAWEEGIRSFPPTATPITVHSSRRQRWTRDLYQGGEEGREATLPPVTRSWQEATALAPPLLPDRPRTHFPAVVRSALHGASGQ